MQIILQRLWDNAECVQGVLYIDGTQEFFTLELPLLFDGQENVPNKCCIPAGTYSVERLYSSHFNRMVPHVANVPGRSEVEIHPGNTASDIRGCILLGEFRLSDTMVGNSKEACEAFELKFDAALANNEGVNITIKDIQFVA